MGRVVQGVLGKETSLDIGLRDCGPSLSMLVFVGFLSLALDKVLWSAPRAVEMADYIIAVCWVAAHR